MRWNGWEMGYLLSDKLYEKIAIEDENRQEKYLDRCDISQLQKNTQLKLGEINIEFFDRMSSDARIEFAKSNPSLVCKLTDEEKKELVEGRPKRRTYQEMGRGGCRTPEAGKNSGGER